MKVKRALSTTPKDIPEEMNRLIMVLQCQGLNYAPVIIENKRKAEYYEVLEYAQRKGEYPFVQFLVEEMDCTYKIIKKYI